MRIISILGIESICPAAGDEAPVRARGCGCAPPRPHASGRPLLWICWLKACGSSLINTSDATTGGTYMYV